VVDIDLKQAKDLLKKLTEVLRVMLITYEDSTVIIRYNQPPYDFFISIKCNNPESCELMRTLLRYVDFLRHLPF